jgi:hypothetical protein
MSLKAYAIHSIKLLGVTPFTFQQITERTIDHRQTVIYNRGSGSPSPSMAAVATVSPEVTFGTNDIGRFFGIASPTAGLGIKSGNTYTGVEAYYQLKDDLGLRGGANTGIKATGVKAILVPQTLEVAHGSEAKLTATMLWVSADGSTIPIAYTNLVTVPVSFAGEKWTMGGVVANGATIPGVERVTIDFGITIEAKSGEGRPYPSYATIGELVPRITCVTPNVDVMATYSPGGVKLTTGAIVYLRKMQDGTIPYDDASNVHLSFVVQANQGILLPGRGTGSGAGDATQELNIMPLEGVGGAILSYSSPTTIVLP